MHYDKHYNYLKDVKDYADYKHHTSINAMLCAHLIYKHHASNIESFGNYYKTAMLGFLTLKGWVSIPVEARQTPEPIFPLEIIMDGKAIDDITASPRMASSSIWPMANSDYSKTSNTYKVLPISNMWLVHHPSETGNLGFTCFPTTPTARHVWPDMYILSLLRPVGSETPAEGQFCGTCCCNTSNSNTCGGTCGIPDGLGCWYRCTSLFI